MIRETAISTEFLLHSLAELCALPGSADQKDLLTAVAAQLAVLMEASGLDAQVIPTNGAPVVIGRRSGRTPFTLLLYHHYDVAPPGPWRAWHHEPFQLAEREGALFGRGVAAGKGPLAAHLAALAALLGAEGELPCGVVVVAEGEYHGGSANLATVVAEQRAALRAHACLATGGERDAAGRPFCYTGAKGLLQVRLTAIGPNHPLPPGMAASVPNPLWRLTWALAQIKSDQEEILINGFYDDVESPRREENRAMRALRLNESGRLAAWGIPQFLFGMTDATLITTEATLPTCNVSGLSVDPPTDLATLPVVATAQLDFQLVPRQRPKVIDDQLVAHLRSRGFDDIAVERLPGGYPPAHTSLDHPYIACLREAGAQAFGDQLSCLPLGAFAQPLFFFTEAFDMPVAALGCARPDSAVYGPNERIPLDDLIQHGQVLIALLQRCADAAWTGAAVPAAPAP